MAKGTCGQAGCTVAETGICLLSHAEVETCPHFRTLDGNREATATDLPSAVETEASPEGVTVARRFPTGLELGTEDAAEIMRGHYAYMVGILGSWDAGKTCYLLSLYLMASRGALPSGYQFAGSQTLPGFEARARRLRKWKGGPLPEQLADHTHLADPRQPAFLHLALRETGSTKQRFEILLTDLPGEWSKNLIDRAATADTFMFLRRADGLIIVIDGPLLNSHSRNSEVQRTKHLLDRLVESVHIEKTVPLILLVSKSDRIQCQRPKAIDEIQAYGMSLGLNPEVILCAAFSSTPETVPNGLGVFETIAKILQNCPAPRNRESTRPKHPMNTRVFLTFQE